METTRLVGLVSTGVGFALLIVTFVLGYYVFEHYQGATPSSDLTTTMGTLLFAAIQALFLGIMGWVGSLLMLRGIDFDQKRFATKSGGICRSLSWGGAGILRDSRICKMSRWLNLWHFPDPW